MHYLALALDYDGTLATNGKVNDDTLAALKQVKESGRKLLLVTGRHLDDLLQVFPELDWFDRVVAENGALIYSPATKQEHLLGELPPEAFIQELRDRGVDNLGVGKVIVATWTPHETTVLETIRDFGLERQVIFNKGAVMILPSGINKAAGLKAALEQMGLSPHNVVGVGDAENDQAFLDVCQFSVAVDNALPIVKEKCDWVTQGSRGEGVIEVINHLLSSDLEECKSQSQRRQILLGQREDGSEVNIQPHGTSLLLAGTSGGGKSTLATGILERLIDQEYQICIIDPEGDYNDFEGAVVLGSSHQTPDVKEVLDLLEQPHQNLVVNLLGVKLEQRPAFFMGLLPTLLEMRVRTGRPHWILVDEAHHLLPSSWDIASITLPQALNGMILITVHPDHVAVPALKLVDTLIAIGKEPAKTLTTFCNTIGHCPPDQLMSGDLEQGIVLGWFQKTQQSPFRFKIEPPRMERRRHVRNYAEGNLGDDKCFVFRGAEQKLNLKAQNLMMFTQLAAGIDEDTWLYHLHQQDYSTWFREAIKDDSLADEAAEVENQADLTADDSRDRILSLVEQRYTLPA